MPQLKGHRAHAGHKLRASLPSAVPVARRFAAASEERMRCAPIGGRAPAALEAAAKRVRAQHTIRRPIISGVGFVITNGIWHRYIRKADTPYSKTTANDLYGGRLQEGSSSNTHPVVTRRTTPNAGGALRRSCVLTPWPGSQMASSKSYLGFRHNYRPCGAATVRLSGLGLAAAGRSSNMLLRPAACGSHAPGICHSTDQYASSTCCMNSVGNLHKGFLASC